MADDVPLVLLLADKLQMRGGTADTLRLARGLPQRGFRVRLIAQNARQLSTDVRREVNVREITQFSIPILNRLAFNLLETEFGKQKPNLIHIQSRRLLSAGHRLAAKWNVPLTVNVHDYPVAREAPRLRAARTTRIIAVSRAVSEHLVEKINLDPELIRVIPSGIEVPPLERTSPVLEPGRLTVIGTAGALEYIKGIHFFLGAAQRVLTRFPAARFLISGSGPEEERLRQLARSLEIHSSITFVPSLNDFSAAIEAMDVFCLTSLQQGLGTIMLEAMGRGRPVIATDTGGVSSAVRHHENGLIVRPGDIDSLADAMIELLSDPSTARQLGQRARELVIREFGIDRMLNGTAELYLELLARPATVA